MKASISRRTLLGVLLLTLVTATACGPFNAGNRQRAMVIFTNESLDQADVYATVAGASAVRLGTVLATRTDTLYASSSVTGQGGTTSIVARLFGRNLQPSTGPITLRADDVIHVRLTGDGRYLVVTSG